MARQSSSMMDLIPGIRNGVRAVIVKDDHLLLLRKEYEDGSKRYVLPGGSQDLGETLAERIQLEDHFIADDELQVFFNAADVVVLDGQFQFLLLG